MPLRNYEQNIRNDINEECFKRICEHKYSNDKNFNNILECKPIVSDKNVCIELSNEFFKLISIDDNSELGSYDFRKISFVSVVEHVRSKMNHYK